MVVIEGVNRARVVTSRRRCYFATMNNTSPDSVWSVLRREALEQSKAEPVLTDFFNELILRHSSLEKATAHLLAGKLRGAVLDADQLEMILDSVLLAHPSIGKSLQRDLTAAFDRDCAARHLYQVFCFSKGFHSLATYRAMHTLWLQNQRQTALLLQSRISAVLDIDIHPAARIGDGIMFDHATGIVIGETAVVGNDVSIMQSVTLGGTGKESGDRHPKIGNGVLISVGAIILGNITVGDGAQIAAGSVVLEAVPPHTVVAGVPARIVGTPLCQQPALNMDHGF